MEELTFFKGTVCMMKRGWLDSIMLKHTTKDNRVVFLPLLSEAKNQPVGTLMIEVWERCQYFVLTCRIE